MKPLQTSFAEVGSNIFAHVSILQYMIREQFSCLLCDILLMYLSMYGNSDWTSCDQM